MTDDQHLFAAAQPVPHPTAAERTAAGRTARKRLPRSAHAGWTPPADRPDPVALVLGQEETRVADLLPIRHERMLASPFAFYRGAAIVMASDLATRPNSGLTVQLCGDAHVANFGGFLAPDRTTVFDVNDFDETHPGPFEWDVMRLAASLVLAAQAIGCPPDRCREIAARSVASYRRAMTEFAAMRTLDVWYARLDAEGVMARAEGEVTRGETKRFQQNLQRSSGKDNLKALAKLTETVDGEVRFRSDPPLVTPLRDLAHLLAPDEDPVGWIHQNLRSYRTTLPDDRRHLLEQFRLVDAARKVVGVGSVGTRCWIVLMLGRDDTDPLVLQIKEARASVLEPYTHRSRFANHGQRVVQGQRLLQASSDVMLGWMRTKSLEGADTDFYVRQLWDGKFSVDLEHARPGPLAVNGELCGWMLARGHARSGDRIAIAAYLGSSDVFDRAITDFAEDYARQAVVDHAAFARALGVATP